MSALQAAQLANENLVIAQMNDLMQSQINRLYTSKEIPGKEYSDTVTLVDSKLPDSNRGLRNGLAQQLLHNQMVEMQYSLTDKK
jgi:hypothetical protein